MKKILFFILLFVILAVSAWMIFHRNKSENNYFVVTGNDAAFSLGDPVYVDGVVSGFINNVSRISDSSSHTLISFNLNDNVKIPSKTDPGVLLIDTARLYIALDFETGASTEYLHPGDTVYLVLDKIERAIKKAAIKKEPVKIVAAKSPDIVQSPAQLPSDLIFKIQVLTASMELPANSLEFRGLKNITHVEQGGIYKYYAGESPHLKEARVLKEKVVAAGITDAFIVPFYNGKRISMKEALSMEK